MPKTGALLIILCSAFYSFHYVGSPMAPSYPSLQPQLLPQGGAGCSLGSRALSCKGLDHSIDPSWWMDLQFGLLSVPTSDPELVHQRLFYVLSCCEERSAYKRSFATYLIE